MSERPMCNECKKELADAKEVNKFYCASCWLSLFKKSKGVTYVRTSIERTKEGAMS